MRRGTLEVSLPAFGYTVLRVESRPLPALEPLPRPAPAAASGKPAGGAVVKARSGTLHIDAETGLADAWVAGGVTLAAGMDLALPEGLQAEGPASVSVRDDGSVQAVRRFGGHTLTLAYARSGEGVEVRAGWRGGVPEGAALAVAVPGAERWFAASAEGVFESPFRVRHPGFDGAVGSIYRLPQGTASLWDSRLHPFGVDAAHARVGAQVGRWRVSLGFEPARLPASAQLLDRMGGDHGLKVLAAWRGEEAGVTVGGDELTLTLGAEKAEGAPAGDGGTGDARLTAAGGGWVFENAHYRARVGRSGVLAELWRKDGAAWRAVARRSCLYTDRGFAGDKKMSQEDDVEASARLERDGSGLRLRFCGEMRGFYRFDKMARPVRFYSEYRFDDGPAFGSVRAFCPEAPADAGKAFLSLLTNVEELERAEFADAGGVFLSGARGDGRARAAQTAAGAEPQRLPEEIRLSDARGLALRLSGLRWFGARPANVFLHGRDLHVAWLDGAAGRCEVGRWSGVAMSVSCEPGAARLPAEPPPFAPAASAGLLRDGGFEAAEAAGLRLARAGTRLPAEAKERRLAWLLPRGAERVAGPSGSCVRVDGDGQEYRMIRQQLPVQAFPAGSSWRLTARLKGEAVEKGEPAWKTACVRWGLHTGERVAFATASLPPGDSDWREVSVEMTVPEGVTAVSAEAGLNGNKGRLWIDDVRVERAGVRRP
jgi:hypothetical protein